MVLACCSRENRRKVTIISIIHKLLGYLHFRTNPNHSKYGVSMGDIGISKKKLGKMDGFKENLRETFRKKKTTMSRGLRFVRNSGPRRPGAQATVLQPVSWIWCREDLRWGWLVVEVWRCSRIDWFFFVGKHETWPLYLYYIYIDRDRDRDR